jgi:hypothetical protein
VGTRRFGWLYRRDQIDGGGAAKRPLPVCLALYARAGLVAGDHLPRTVAAICSAAAPNGLLYVPDVGDRALGDCQAEQAFAQLGQMLEADHPAPCREATAAFMPGPNGEPSYSPGDGRLAWGEVSVKS